MEDLSVKAIVQAVLDERGFKNLDEALAKNRTGITQTQDVADRMGYSFDNLKNKLLALGSAGAVIAFLKNSFVEFAATERQWGAVVAQLRALGDATGDVAAQSRIFIDRLAEQSGILDDDLIPAFNRLVLGTKNVAASQELLRIAAKFAANGIGDVKSNAEKLALAFQTGSIRSLREFGIETDNADGSARNLAEGIQELSARSDTMADHLDDAQAKIDTLRAKWDAFGDSAGSAINDAINWLEELSQAQTRFNKEHGLISIIDPKTLAGQEILAREADERAQARQAARAKSDNAAALARLAAYRTELAEKEKLDKEREAAAKAAADLAIKRSQLEVQATKDSVAAQVDLAQDGTEQKRQLLLKQIQLEEDAALKSARDVRASEATLHQIRQTFANRREALERDFTRTVKEETAKRSAAERAAMLKIMGIAADKAEVSIALLRKQWEAEQKLAEGVIQLEQRKAQETRNAQDATLAAVSGTIMTLWGRNKAAASAAALIDAYAAAARALKDYPAPYSYVVAALALAAGLGRVKQIQSTNLGFDDPTNDRMAYLGGRRWADDFIRHTAKGFGDRMYEAGRPGGAPSTVINNTRSFAPSTVTNINLNGGFYSTDQMKRFKRELDRVDRQVVRRSRVA